MFKNSHIIAAIIYMIHSVTTSFWCSTTNIVSLFFCCPWLTLRTFRRSYMCCSLSGSNLPFFEISLIWVLTAIRSVKFKCSDRSLSKDFTRFLLRYSLESYEGSMSSSRPISFSFLGARPPFELSDSEDELDSSYR